MKKKILAFLALLCLASMLFPTAVSALPPSDYAPVAEALRNDAFKDYQPTYSGTSFTGYPGPYTVGYFPVSDPKNLNTYRQFWSQYSILCRSGSATSGDPWTYGGMYLSRSHSVTSDGTYIGNLTRTIVVDTYATAITYTAEKSGLVTLSLDALAIWNQNDGGYSNCIFGLDFAIFKNGEKIYPATGSAWKNFSTPNNLAHNTAYAFTAAQRAETTLNSVAVQEGDQISFAVTRDGTHPCYHAFVLPRVTYTAYCGETYAMAESFSSLQGHGGYYAAYSQAGKEAVYLLPQYDATTSCFGGNRNAGTVSRTGLTVKPGYDTVLLFRSPLIATYTLSSNSFHTNTALSFTAAVYRADGTVTNLSTKSYTASSAAFTPVSGIELDRGDVLAMRFSAAADATVTFSPLLSSTGTVHATSKNGEAFTTLTSGMALKPDIYLDAVAASLSGDISLHFYTYLSSELLNEAEEYGMLFFDEEQEDYSYSAANAYTDAIPLDNMLVYTYTGIAAKEMTDVVYARPYCKTADGYVYGELRTASVQAYAESLRKNYYGSATAQGSALYKLACAMLNYGAEAQTYFNYRIDTLANAALTEAEKQTPLGEYENKLSLSGETTLADYGFTGATLLLNDLPALRILMKAQNGAAMDGIKIEFSLSADFQRAFTYTPEWSPANKAYGISIEGVPASKMRSDMYFRITNGTGYSQVLSYSPETYAARSHTNNLDSCNVVDALFAYSDAAVHYANLSEQGTDGILITAQALVDAIRTGTVTENAIYCISDAASMIFTTNDVNRSYNAKGITVYIDKPLVLSGADGMQLSNLHLMGTNYYMTTLQVQSTENAVLDNITITGHAAVGMEISDSERLFLKGTSVTGTIETGIVIDQTASEVYLTNATLDVTTLGVQDAGKIGIYMKDSTIRSSGDGVSLLTAGSELRDCAITATGNGIYLNGAVDTLVARNTVTGSILGEDCDNTVLLKNTATSLTVKSGENMYVVSNTLSGRLTLEGNNYLLADLNTEAAVTDSNNANKNGDDVTDVDARLAVGADESLLPHVDRDQFLYHPRKETVRTADGAGKSFAAYLTECMKSEDEVIIAPGVYRVYGNQAVNGWQNKNVYAFGAMAEQQSYLKAIFSIDGCSNLTFHGLTLGFAQQSCGQVYVLDKLADNTLLVITGAGMLNEFGNTNASYYNTTGMGAQRAGTFYAYCDTGFNRITKNADGTMNMAVSSGVYNTIAKGDILTCRSTNSGTTVSIYNSGDVTFRDMTLYGNSGGFAFVEGTNRTATSYYRVADTTKNGPIISKEVYDHYKMLESTYGVALELAIDTDGNYRGSLPHIGSIDATHTTKCKEGSKAISCLFENMCDDGTNQNHTHGRLHSVTDNGNGTTTIVYKGNLSEYSYVQGNRTAGGFCHDFSVGDRVYVYTSAGQLVCDTEALTATVDAGSISVDWAAIGLPSAASNTVQLKSVTVATSAVNQSALTGYDLTANHWENKNKVLIDNMSMASTGFTFDNTVVRNIRSRGLLIKTSNSTIKNCTLENIGMSAVAILYEIYWGESGVTENLDVQNNLIKHTGYFKNQDLYSPISITGLGSKADDDYLLYKNINITGNRFVDRTTSYAVYVNSAKDILIENNDFGARKGYTVANDYAPAIHIFCANGIEINGNTYPTGATTNAGRFLYTNASNIYGTDVTGVTSSASLDALANSMPVISGDSVTYPGNWQMGYMSSESVKKSILGYVYSYSMPSFSVFSKYVGGWIGDTSYTSGDNVFSKYGGFFASSEYRTAAQSKYNCVIRYTAPKAGTVDVSLTSLLTPASGDGNGYNDGYIAIFKNNEMIWPSKGNASYYDDASKWYTLSASSDPLEAIMSISNSLSGLTLAEGDCLYFVSKQKSGWSASAMSPAVNWHEA